MKTATKLILLMMIIVLFAFVGCKSNPDAKQNEELQVVKETVANDVDNDVDNDVIDDESMAISDEDSMDLEELSEKDMKLIDKDLEDDDEM